MTEKYKIWDCEKKQWFKPTYPRFYTDKNNKQVQVIKTEEILFSQSGEMYLRTNDGEGSPEKLTLIINTEDEPRFIACVNTGMRDSNKEKIYEGHIVKIVIDEGDEEKREEIGVVEYERAAGAWGPFIEMTIGDDYILQLGTAIDAMCHVEIIGHKLSNTELVPVEEA